MKIKNLTISSICASALLLSSCGEESKAKVDAPIKEAPKAQVELEDNTFNSEDYDFAIPSPIALFTTFKEAGMTFHSDRTNPVSNFEDYATKSEQIINFGVYSADLTYAVILDKKQETRDYFKVLEGLANKFGMGSVFSDEEIATSFEENIGNKSELEDLLFDIHDKSQVYLDDNEMRFLAAIQFSGAWIEGMYLGSADFAEADIETLRYKVVDQISLLDNCIRGLEAYPDQDETIVAFYNGLKELQNIYNSFESVKAAKGAGIPDLTKDDITKLTSKIEEVRNSII